ncbi:transporter [Sphingomonas sp. SUN019]|uniref:transporter n=1 Tax=Sphingomonas sp. SUN019 TaxID=2937788 RepID=UPI002164A038|nr:transporter [Sphingomonas sp. SUN019]UVO51430.1 transporter [Sphingomonas sp. SUN019]
MHPVFLLAALLLVLPLPALAQDREMVTDRPDKTESPYTVPAGRVQVELDVATYTRDRSDGFRLETIGVTPVNLKLGLARNTDVQLIVAPYIHQIATDLQSGARTKTGGFGDITLRLKQNLWGNDDGTTAFGLMPYVTLPTSTNGVGTGKVEFGLIAPLAIKLSDAVDLGVMTEIDVVADDDARGHRINFVNSATLGFSLTDKLGLYTEIFTEKGAAWNVTGDAGITYKLTDELQLDTGLNLGLTDAADDVMAFVGLSRRF